MTLQELQYKRDALTKELNGMDVYDMRKFQVKRERNGICMQIAQMKIHAIVATKKESI